MRRSRLIAALTAVVALGLVFAGTPARAASDVRLTNDRATLGGYVSNYTMVTGQPYTDDVLQACSQAGGRQNEPAVAVNPRNPDVIVGSSNDYCPVFNEDGTLLGLGDIWLGYYRSEDGGNTFVSSLVPGYQGDESPYAANAHVRTADSGDPVLAWDNEGRLFAGSESSSDPAGTAKTFGDVWVASFENPGGTGGDSANDGKKFVNMQTVAQGSAAPGLLGVFHDKTSIEVDRTGGACEGVVYFAWARFTGGGSNGYNSSVYVVRSTDHGATFSEPLKISQTVHDIQFPDISITGNGHVYITYREFADVRSHTFSDGIAYNKSTNCGASFGSAHRILSFEPYDPTDISSPAAEGDSAKKKAVEAEDPDAGEAEGEPAAGEIAGDCGDFAAHCESGYTFARGGTQVRSSADQGDDSSDYVYLVYDPSIPGTEVDSGTTYGSITSADLPAKYHQTKGSQSGIYFFRLDGAAGTHTAPTLIDDPRENGGLQRFPDINADAGSLHAIWWDSRNDSCYDPARPLGNCADLSTVPSLDAFASAASTSDLDWSDAVRLSTETTNPNYEQFGGRTVPFAGDYLYVSSVGDFSFGVWTDWRDVVSGVDPREENDPDGTVDNADVHQCRTQDEDGNWSADHCPWEGGLDQNIYGSVTP